MLTYQWKKNGNPISGATGISYTLPTVSASDELRIEVHLLDTTMNLYDQKLSVRFLKRVRDEKRFEDKESLINQLKNDEITVRNIFLAVHTD